MGAAISCRVGNAWRQWKAWSSFKTTAPVWFLSWVEFSTICNVNSHFLNNKSGVGDNYTFPILVLTVLFFFFSLFVKYALLTRFLLERYTERWTPFSPVIPPPPIFPFTPFSLNKTRDNVLIFQPLRCCCEVGFQPGLLFSPASSIYAELSFSARGCGLILNGTDMNAVSIFLI